MVSNDEALFVGETSFFFGFFAAELALILGNVGTELLLLDFNMPALEPFERLLARLLPLLLTTIAVGFIIETRFFSLAD